MEPIAMLAVVDRVRGQDAFLRYNWAMRPARLSLSAVVLGSLVWAALEARVINARLAAEVPDVAIDERVMVPNQSMDDFIAAQAARVGAREVYIDAGHELLPSTLSELGIELDVPRTLERARLVPIRSRLDERVCRIIAGPPLEPLKVQPAFSLDPQKLRARLQKLAIQVRRAPVDAALDLEHHRRVEATVGRELDVDATLQEIAAASRDEGSAYRLVYRDVAASTRLTDLAPVDVSQVLSRFETDFTHRAGARAVNIRRGAQLLDRTIVQPGAVFSFNRAVGPRTERRGFINAPVIIHDEIDKGAGGGICQVASTLHAAALYGGLRVLERRSHSRPSGYVPLGLDATVIDGKVDLRLQNPFDSPLMIHAVLPTRTTLRIELLGKNPEGPVEHRPQVIKRHPFLRRIVEKEELAPGSFKCSQKGSYGYDIVSVVTHTRADGRLTARRYASKYYPVPEVFWVGPGTLLSALPPLPDGAEGIEAESPIFDP
jgi:vancomycin resistance protein YoaR